jgi:hypothetical protein
MPFDSLATMLASHSLDHSTEKHHCYDTTISLQSHDTDRRSHSQVQEAKFDVDHMYEEDTHLQHHAECQYTRYRGKLMIETSAW